MTTILHYSFTIAAQYVTDWEQRVKALEHALVKKINYFATYHEDILLTVSVRLHAKRLMLRLLFGVCLDQEVAFNVL